MSKSVLLAGGSGLIGSRLVEMLSQKGYVIHVLSRKKHKQNGSVQYHQWDLDTMEIDFIATNVDYIINLTGAGIADRRWTAARKKVLISSRINAAKLLYQNIKEQNHKPKAYISSSAVGVYGDRGEEVLKESSSPGEGFMSECCIAWEAAAMKLSDVCGRIIINRIGIVFSKKGGALPKILMTKPVLSYFGDGSQYYSWIHIDDVCNVFIANIEQSEMSGVYNVVSPQPLTNKELIKEIKNVTGGVVLPAPKLGLRLAFGEMADVILNSNRVIPENLNKYNFKWSYIPLTKAIEDILERGV